MAKATLNEFILFLPRSSCCCCRFFFCKCVRSGCYSFDAEIIGVVLALEWLYRYVGLSFCFSLFFLSHSLGTIFGMRISNIIMLPIIWQFEGERKRQNAYFYVRFMWVCFVDCNVSRASCRFFNARNDLNRPVNGNRRVCVSDVVVFVILFKYACMDPCINWHKHSHIPHKHKKHTRQQRGTVQAEAHTKHNSIGSFMFDICALNT